MPTIAVYVPARIFRELGSDADRVREICKSALGIDQGPVQTDPAWVAPPIPDTPDTVAEKAKAARAIADKWVEPPPIMQRADDLVNPDWK